MCLSTISPKYAYAYAYAYVYVYAYAYYEPIGQVVFRAVFLFGHIFDFFDFKICFFWKNYNKLTILTFLGPRTCQQLTFYAPGDPRGADRDPRVGRGAPRAPFRHPYWTLAGFPMFSIKHIF